MICQTISSDMMSTADRCIQWSRFLVLLESGVKELVFLGVMLLPGDFGGAAGAMLKKSSGSSKFWFKDWPVHAHFYLIANRNVRPNQSIPT